MAAVALQAGRRGIATARELLGLASPLAESPMESEARLLMLDAGLPPPVPQYEVLDRRGRTWRLDFAWPELCVGAEYDGVDWHSGPEAFRRDRERSSALQELVHRAHDRRRCQASARRPCPPARHAATTGRVRVS